MAAEAESEVRPPGEQPAERRVHANGVELCVFEWSGDGPPVLLVHATRLLAAGHDAEQVVDTLMTYSRYPVPHALLVDVAETMDRYGRLQLQSHPTHGLVLVAFDRAVLVEVTKSKKLAGMLGERVDEDTVAVHPSERGRLKQGLLKLGWPAEDLAGYVDGEAHPIELATDGWHLRPYQREAIDNFWAGGSGVVVLPCGAGKTLVGAGVMAEAKATTLILVTNTVAGRQWTTHPTSEAAQ